MNRNFSNWLSSMRESIAGWKFYADFPKVYNNVASIKVELNILNSLIGSHNIEDEFRSIVTQYPNTLKAIPILLAKREKEIKVNDAQRGQFLFNFNKPNYSIDDYVAFMKNTGLFDLLENHLISSLVDYVTGVEVGMDTNGRKNRMGDTMEDLVEIYIRKAGFIEGTTYFKEMGKEEIERRFHIDLSPVTNDGKTEKRFDFVLFKNGRVYALECNFYSSQGSKLNETARSYKTLALEAKDIQNFTFVWITDGKGWNTARHNLEETFDVLDTMYNIKDLEEGILEKI